ncbi:MAG: hypothetical protein ABL857_07510 [Rickettsiales bacterium]
MRRLLSLFLLVFSTVSYAADVKIIRGVEEKKPAPQLIDIIKESPPTPAPKKEKKQNPQEIMALAINHCLKIEDAITEHFRLVRTFNEPMANDLVLPDFGFIFGQEWNVTTRIPRTKLNSILLLRLSEKFGFKFGALKFHGNCKAEMLGKITRENNLSYAKIKMPLAFDTEETNLTYQAEKQDGYNWIIADILVSGESLRSYNYGNVGASINKLCGESSFGTLQCN